MIQFLKRFKHRSIKIAQVNMILLARPINLQLFTLILYGLL